MGETGGVSGGRRGGGNIKTLEIPRFNRPARVGGFSGEKDD